MKILEKRICPSCNKVAYSADHSYDWTCPHCGGIIPHLSNGAYRCEVCGDLVAEGYGITTESGLWVCDSDSCRTLDDENNAHEKQNGPQELELQTDPQENSFTQSIPQNEEFIPIVVDFFVGTVLDFRSYLKAKRTFLEAEVLSP